MNRVITSGQYLDLPGRDAGSLTRLAGAGCLKGGIEGGQPELGGNPGDGVHGLADPGCAPGERALVAAPAAGGPGDTLVPMPDRYQA